MLHTNDDELSGSSSLSSHSSYSEGFEISKFQAGKKNKLMDSKDTPASNLVRAKAE